MVRIRPRLSSSNFQPKGGALDAILYQSPPNLWQRIGYSPALFIARKAFPGCIPRTPSPQNDLQDNATTARVVCISDTHNHHDQLPPLPPGDILIHAGDLTVTGTASEVDRALAWLHEAPHQHKIVIAGNHDSALARRTTRHALLAPYPSLTYLQDTSTVIEVRGRLLSVYGSPRTPIHGAGSFHYPRGRGVWDVPPFTDVLVTHGPPACYFDAKQHGCPQLLTAITRTQPLLHVFGHIHAGRGVQCVRWGRSTEAYERAWMGDTWTRYVSALTLLTEAVWMKFRGRPRFQTGDTILVNASSQGGYMDELRRGPIVIDVPLPDRE